LVVFEPVSKAEQELLQSRLSSLDQELVSLKNVISLLESQLDSKDVQIASLINENSSLDSFIRLLESKLRVLENDGKSNEEILFELKKDLNVLLIERDEAMRNSLTGLFAFGAGNSGLLLGLFALIALIVVAVFVKSRTSSIYSTSLFGDDDMVHDVNDEDSNDSDLSSLNQTRITPFNALFSKLRKKEAHTVKPSNKKKWAVESYFPEKKVDEEVKKTSLGDLIKKE
jgi:hypothetical protein